MRERLAAGIVFIMGPWRSRTVMQGMAFLSTLVSADSSHRDLTLLRIELLPDSVHCSHPNKPHIKASVQRTLHVGNSRLETRISKVFQSTGLRHKSIQKCKAEQK